MTDTPNPYAADDWRFPLFEAWRRGELEHYVVGRWVAWTIRRGAPAFSDRPEFYRIRPTAPPSASAASDRQPATVRADGQRVHRLKCWPQFYAKVRTNEKRYEIRKDDRDFQVGDYLDLSEWDPHHADFPGPGDAMVMGAHTGRSLMRRVSYLMRDFPGLAPGYVLMSIAPIEDAPAASGEARLEIAGEGVKAALRIWMVEHREHSNDANVVHLASSRLTAELWMREQTEQEWERGYFVLLSDTVDASDLVSIECVGFYDLSGTELPEQPYIPDEQIISALRAERDRLAEKLAKVTAERDAALTTGQAEVDRLAAELATANEAMELFHKEAADARAKLKEVSDPRLVECVPLDGGITNAFHCLREMIKQEKARADAAEKRAEACSQTASEQHMLAGKYRSERNAEKARADRLAGEVERMRGLLASTIARKDYVTGCVWMNRHEVEATEAALAATAPKGGGE